MLLVFLGPPGSGKGTQSKRLLEHFRLPHLSTGELLRQAIQANTPLGRLAVQYMNQGKLVPDPLVLSLVGEVLERPEYAPGCLFDGFPRTLQQARSLDEFLGGRGTPLDVVVELRANEDELIARMLRRAAVERRADDTPQTIKRRMEVYNQQTHPLVEYYHTRGLLETIDALGSTEDVFERIRSRIEARAHERVNQTM